jgi:D-serine deaminase-like pyridoxal phosphate-dependent protein
MRYFQNGTRAGFRLTDIRPGNYVFGDAMQVALGAVDLDQCALTVQATVVSKRRDAASGTERVFLDAGKKILTADTGALTTGHGLLLYNAAAMRRLPHAVIDRVSEEHAWVRVPGAATVDVGDTVRLVPNHACLTVATQDALVLVDDDEVVATLPVAAARTRRAVAAPPEAVDA